MANWDVIQMRPVSPHAFERLNTVCTCETLDWPKMYQALTTAIGDTSLCEKLFFAKPSLVPTRPIYLARRHIEAIRDTVRAIGAVIKLPDWREEVMAHAPALARIDRGTSSVLMSYDFYLSVEGPKLIEIDTNAGGALINAYLLEAQRACYVEIDELLPTGPRLAHLSERLVEMFLREWCRAGRLGFPCRMAIVDRMPRDQSLYEEFVLFQRLVERYGLRAVIADPGELTFDGRRLSCQGEAIDLVYSRLADFALEDPSLSALRKAFIADKVVLTPDPQAHARLANKRNLELLSNAVQLRALGASEALVGALIKSIPATRIVTPDLAYWLWERRGQLFFKPFAGFGGKATYRGDELTRDTFEIILRGGYVAQDIVPPSLCSLEIDGQIRLHKMDVRAYAYDDDVLLLAARLYEGQSSNFQTPSGGFAPMLSRVPVTAESTAEIPGWPGKMGTSRNQVAGSS
jgi:hypothetical protein